LFVVVLRQRFWVVPQMLLVFQAGQEGRVVVVGIAILFNAQQYTSVQVYQSSNSAAGMKNCMTVGAEPKVISDVMLPSSAANEVVNLQPAAAIGLRPPTNGTAAMLGHPFQQGGAFRLVH
jgi:hypothetical protein